MLQVYFGHHKCASSWIWDIIVEVCRDAGLNLLLVMDHLTPYGRGDLTDEVNTFSREQLEEQLRRQNVDFAALITADVEQVAALSNFKGFHVVRDPRDLCVSAYYSHLYTHSTRFWPHIAEHREQLKKVDKDEGLFLEMEFLKQEFTDLNTWNYTHPDILEIKLETLAEWPYDTFLRIFDHLELLDTDPHRSVKKQFRTLIRVALNRFGMRKPGYARMRKPMLLSAAILTGHVYEHRYERKAAGRERGVEDQQHHYRKGKSGDWKHHFTPEHSAAFEDLYGDLLDRMGYTNE